MLNLHYCHWTKTVAFWCWFLIWALTDQSAVSLSFAWRPQFDSHRQCSCLPILLHFIFSNDNQLSEISPSIMSCSLLVTSQLVTLSRGKEQGTACDPPKTPFQDSGSTTVYTLCYSHKHVLRIICTTHVSVIERQERKCDRCTEGWCRGDPEIVQHVLPSYLYLFSYSSHIKSHWVNEACSPDFNMMKSQKNELSHSRRLV